jgi:hypothetical protein
MAMATKGLKRKVKVLKSNIVMPSTLVREPVGMAPSATLLTIPKKMVPLMTMDSTLPKKKLYLQWWRVR